MQVCCQYLPRSFESYSLIGWMGAAVSATGSVVALSPGTTLLSGLCFSSVATTA